MEQMEQSIEQKKLSGLKNIGIATALLLYVASHFYPLIEVMGEDFKLIDEMATIDYVLLFTACGLFVANLMGLPKILVKTSNIVFLVLSGIYFFIVFNELRAEVAEVNSAFGQVTSFLGGGGDSDFTIEPLPAAFMFLASYGLMIISIFTFSYKESAMKFDASKLDGVKDSLTDAASTAVEKSKLAADKAKEFAQSDEVAQFKDKVQQTASNVVKDVNAKLESEEVQAFKKKASENIAQGVEKAKKVIKDKTN